MKKICIRLCSIAFESASSSFFSASGSPSMIKANGRDFFISPVSQSDCSLLPKTTSLAPFLSASRARSNSTLCQSAESWSTSIARTTSAMVIIGNGRTLSSPSAKDPMTEKLTCLASAVAILYKRSDELERIPSVFSFSVTTVSRQQSNHQSEMCQPSI